MNNPIRDEALLKELILLKQKDPDAFADMVLGIIKRFPELAVQDEHPLDEKLKALNLLLQNHEGREKYEDCAFIVDIKKKIEDGEQE